MSTQTTDRGEATRRRILEVAARHLLERGYAGTSLNEVIRDSGLTKGGFYFHFTSKAEVALATLDMVRGEWRDHILSNAGYQPRAVDQIVALVRSAAAGKENAPAGTAIGRLCQELAAQPGLADRVRPYDAWFALVADLFRRAQSEGDMDPTVDADAAAHYAVCAFLGIDMVADVSGDRDLVLRVVDQYLTFTFAAVGISAPTYGAPHSP